MRKTIKVSEFVREMNATIAYVTKNRETAPDSWRAELSAMCFAVEKVLHAADAYRGFSFLVDDETENGTFGATYFSRRYNIADAIM